MRLPETANVTDQILMLWIIDRFSAHFKKSAILKGGMHLALLSSQRSTNDVDYTFVPFSSKSEIAPEIEKLLSELPEVSIQKTMHSTSGRFIIKVGNATTQVEFNVSVQAKSEPLSTEVLANRFGSLPRVIRVLSPDVELSNKLAAWNERRLLRDLYDIYYWYSVVNVMPESQTLIGRLSKINSRIPKLKKKKSMTLDEFLDQLDEAITLLSEETFYQELRALIPMEKLDGVLPGFKTQLKELVSKLRRTEQT